MRFEIKAGGVTAILFGVAALSSAVFMLGLLAGYDVGRESQSSAAQVATAYPVAAPPTSTAASAESAATPGNATATASALTAPPKHPATAAAAIPAPVNPVAPIAPIATAKPVLAKHPKPPMRSPPSEAASLPQRMAPEARPPSGDMNAPAPGADIGEEAAGTSGIGAEPGAGEAPVPHAAAGVIASARPQPRHKPFNIQIEAAMDRGGANEMAHRLQALGYQPHLVPAQLNGQTWYKVVIGPYATQEAAASAQQEMRAKYNSIYGGGASTGSGTLNSRD